MTTHHPRGICRLAAWHYVLIFAIMSFYGSQVCNFLESLITWQWTAIIAVGLGAGFLLRHVLTRRHVDAGPPHLRSRRQYIVELAVIALVGVAIMFYNHLAYGFPLGSGLKGVLGFATLGFFTAADLALLREYDTALDFEEQGLNLDPEARYFSLPSKFAGFAVVCALLVSGVLALLVVRDLELVIASGDAALADAAIDSVIREILVVLGILVTLLINLTVSYSRNLRYFFRRQTATLHEVTEGSLSAHVPVSTADEFGVIAKHTNVMIDRLRNRTHQLEATQDATIVALASLAETRDNETGMHIRRTQAYVRALAEQLRDHPRFAAYLTPARIDLLEKSAPLHDIGKVGVPDAILLKPGKLDPDEWEIMKLHTVYGAEALSQAEQDLGANSFLHLAWEIAYTHHEKWNGEGYPRRTKGEDIPIAGRLMAIADVYDALISKRVYKPAFPHEKAKAIILDGKGEHFDPAVVDAFRASEAAFTEIAARLADPAGEDEQEETP